MDASEMDVLERAYGVLWSDHGGSTRAHQARKLLLSRIGKEGQRRGIQYALDNKPEHQGPVGVTGIHLLRLGDYVIVNAEIDGRWVEVIREIHDGSFSHIVEPGGMISALLKHRATT